MTIDPQAKAILEIATAGAPLNERGVEGARQWSAEMAAPPEPSDDRLEIEDLQANGVGIRLYRPAGTSETPVLMFIHGGGWVLGNLESADYACRQLCLHSGVSVVNVDYRLAPEVRFPEPLNDCVAVLRWIIDEGANHRLAPGTICVAGESSGGHLAASTCLRAAELGLPISLQLLVNPVIDPGLDTPSWREFGDEYLPVSCQMSWMWDLYAGSNEVRNGDPLVNLTIYPDLGGLPTTIILTSEYDPLRDEAEMYAERLREAGVPVELRRLDGQVHAVFGFAKGVDACTLVLQETGKDVGKRLHHQPIGGKS